MVEDQNSEELEVTPHESEATIVENDVPVEHENQTEEIQNDTQDKNWKEMRRKDQENQQKMKLQEDMIKTLLQNVQAPKTEVQKLFPPVEVDEFEGVDDSEFLSKGDSRKMNRKDSRKIAREEYLKMDKERQDANFLPRLQAEHSDFDDVVNSETIAKFEKQDPLLAKTIADLKDPYVMGKLTYNSIRDRKLVKSSSEDRHAKEVNDKIEKNEKTAQSPQVYSKRPMAKAFSMTGMSKEEQSSLYEEMMGYASQGGGY